MITPDGMVVMARYNRWQNTAVYAAASRLQDTERREDLGAFFKSIHGTLNHLLWADQTWLMRFDACPPPAVKDIKLSSTLIADWDELTRERQRFDQVICGWAGRVTADDLAGDLTWFSGATGREFTQPRAQIMMHIFNHQTHHRGQVHALLTRLGQDPGVTDLPLLP